MLSAVTARESPPVKAMTPGEETRGEAKHRLLIRSLSSLNETEKRNQERVLALEYVQQLLTRVPHRRRRYTALFVMEAP